MRLVRNISAQRCRRDFEGQLTITPQDPETIRPEQRPMMRSNTANGYRHSASGDHLGGVTMRVGTIRLHSFALPLSFLWVCQLRHS
jgi:hypothetical protein